MNCQCSPPTVGRPPFRTGVHHVRDGTDRIIGRAIPAGSDDAPNGPAASMPRRHAPEYKPPILHALRARILPQNTLDESNNWNHAARAGIRADGLSSIDITENR